METFFFLRRPWPTVAFIDIRSPTILSNVLTATILIRVWLYYCAWGTPSALQYITFDEKTTFIMSTYFRYSNIHSITYFTTDSAKGRHVDMKTIYRYNILSPLLFTFHNIRRHLMPSTVLFRTKPFTFPKFYKTTLTFLTITVRFHMVNYSL
jgi:hypothetical protein